MKARLIGACAVLVGTVVFVLLMTMTPQPPAAPTPAPSPVQPRPSRPTTSTAPTPAATPAEFPAAPSSPLPLPTETEIAAIEGRIGEKFKRWPALVRLKMAWVSSGREMSDEEYERARALYLRFLDNFARLDTAQFRVESYESVNGGPEEKLSVDDVVWSPPRFWVERTRQEKDGASSKWHTVCDGSYTVQWEDGGELQRERAGSWQFPGGYLFSTEMSNIGEANPFFINGFSHCEIDDGTRGYSRLWSERGYETRFDSRGLLIERRDRDGYGVTYTYQNLNGRWFPLEVTHRETQSSPEGPVARTYRQVLSAARLNEPVDETLFQAQRTLSEGAGGR